MRNPLSSRAVIRRTCTAAAFSLAALGAASARAQSYGLQTQIFVQATAGSHQTTNFGNSGFVQSAGPVSYQFTSSASDHLASATATGQATSFYGFLDASGSGHANPGGGNGTESRVIPDIGGAPDAMFEDQITVLPGALPTGTAVTVTFGMNYFGEASFSSEPGGAYLSSASMSSLFRVDDLNNGAPGTSFSVSHGLGTFSDVESVTVAVGDVLRIEGELFGAGEAASFDAAGDSSFSFDDPMHFDIIGLSPGTSLVSASGHNYLQGSVPEPGIWAMLSAGFFGLGAVLRRRRAVPTALA